MTPFFPPPEPDLDFPPPDSFTEPKPPAPKPKEPEPSVVTLGTFGSVQEAHLAKHRLEAAGIRVVLEEVMGGKAASGGGRLVVWETDAERAEKILVKIWKQYRPKKADPELPGDEVASKAMSWSTLGGCVLPVIGNLVSTNLLWQLDRQAQPLSKEGKKKARDARKINRVVFIIAGLLLLGRVSVILLAGSE